MLFLASVIVNNLLDSGRVDVLLGVGHGDGCYIHAFCRGHGPYSDLHGGSPRGDLLVRGRSRLDILLDGGGSRLGAGSERRLDPGRRVCARLGGHPASARVPHGVRDGALTSFTEGAESRSDAPVTILDNRKKIVSSNQNNLNH